MVVYSAKLAEQMPFPTIREPANIHCGPALLNFQAAWGKPQQGQGDEPCPVQNTFIQYPALRDPSLEDFLLQRKARSCPVSGLSEARPQDPWWGASAPIPGEAGSTSSGTVLCPALIAEIAYPVKNTFIEYPALRNPSLEQFLQDREVKSCPPDLASDRSTASTAASEDEEVPVPAPGAAQGPRLVPPRKLAAAGSHAQASNGLATLRSAGSAGHEAGYCKPCAFIWKDGCKSGANCPFCHLCPPGEIKRRKKDKIAWRKVTRVLRGQVLRFGMF